MQKTIYFRSHIIRIVCKRVFRKHSLGLLIKQCTACVLNIDGVAYKQHEFISLSCGSTSAGTEFQKC